MVLLRQSVGGRFMSKSSDLDVPNAATPALNRRKFLSFAPSAAIATSVPAMDAPRTDSFSASGLDRGKLSRALGSDRLCVGFGG